MKVWVAYGGPELVPIAIADSAVELGKMIHRHPQNIRSRWSDYQLGKTTRTRYALVDIGDEEEDEDANLY